MCLLATATRYTTFNFEHFQHSLQAVHAMIQQYHNHPAVIAFQAVNEPNNHTPPNAYQLYTWTAYNMVCQDSYFKSAIVICHSIITLGS
jgi:aryl-phospho-beta-D-glucosidase BglC (GH1 family)